MNEQDMRVTVDNIMRQGGRFVSDGAVARTLLAHNMNVDCLRTNATLRKDEWKQYDTKVLGIALKRLTGIADLERMGLTYDIPNGLGKMVLEYEDDSDVNDATMDMWGITKGNDDTVEYDLNYLPLPLIHADYTINIRMLTASRNGNTPLDTTMAGKKARKVIDYAEAILFNGSSSYAYGGGTIYGYTDFPDRTTGSLTADWATTTGANILLDTRAMKQALINDRHFGSRILYIPTNFETKMDDNYVVNYPTTIRQRILDIEGITDVRVSDDLTASNVVMVEMDEETVRLVRGLPLTNLEWETKGGMLFNFKVMRIAVPQLRSDQENRSGVAHWS